jgi:transcriptional regulator GlxA family with amidase domain
MRAETANVRSTAEHIIAVVVYDGMAIFELAVACEVFDTDHALGADQSWYRLLICGPDSVTLDGGLRMQVPHGLARLQEADTVLVPPCEAAAGPPAEVLQALRRAHAGGARMVSLCTGAFVLAAAGLLDQRRVTTHWAECARFAARFPAVTVDPDVLYVDDGDVLTSAGSVASIDLCLHLVRQDYGAEIATRVARDLVVPPHRDGGQAQYIDRARHGGPVHRHHRLGPCAPARAADGRRPRPARGDEPAHLRPPVHGQHRHDALPVAGAPATAARATAAGDQRSHHRRGGAPQRVPQRRQPA